MFVLHMESSMPSPRQAAYARALHALGVCLQHPLHARFLGSQLDLIKFARRFLMICSLTPQGAGGAGGGRVGDAPRWDAAQRPQSGGASLP